MSAMRDFATATADLAAVIGFHGDAEAIEDAEERARESFGRLLSETQGAHVLR